MPEIATFDENSRIIRVKIRDSASTTGGGKTGLTFESTGLIISTIASSEAAATAYTVAAEKVEDISTLGTYAAPSATKCRFKQVDSTNHPGLYEIQLADARFAIAGAKSLIVSILGAAGMVPVDVHIPLTAFDLGDADPSVDVTKILGTALTETSAGYLAAGLKKLLDVATPIFTLASYNQGADNNTILADLHTTDIPAIKSDTAAIKAKTDMQPVVWYSP